MPPKRSTTAAIIAQNSEYGVYAEDRANLRQIVESLDASGLEPLPELTRQLFDRSGIDPASYVGFRCDVAYPLWRMGYCITFDFRSVAE